MIPKHFIDSLLDRANIEQLISSYVSLKRAGSNLLGLCPFHSEKTPSFTVFPQGNNFYCFGCGVGGDAITFIRKIENVEYKDAIEILAKRMGMTVPQDETIQVQKPKAERNRVLSMNREAALFFHKMLFSDILGAKEALQYLTEKRKLSMTTIKHFGLGYAPNDYKMLSSYLKSKGYTDVEMIEGYLAFKNNNSSYLTDSFRNRVMFPIIDPAGNVVAFGGRVMDDSLPKYKNTSDTPAFKKSKHLFALNFAKNYCKDTLILCEGYMDVISLHEAGFENTVATLGTAITPEQARIMSRYTKRVIISYDMDDAGRRAADKAMRLFEEVGLEVKLLVMQGAKDPDEYIKKFGKENFKRVLEGSDSKFDYQLNYVLSQYNVEDPQQKIEAAKKLVSIIANFPSETERDIYIREVSKRFEITMDSLKRDVKKILYTKEKDAKKKTSQELQQMTYGYRDSVNPDFSKAPTIARYEETVLGLLALYPEYKELVQKGSVQLSENDFFTDFGKKVFSFLFSIKSENDETQNINEIFTPDEVGRITKMKVNRMLLTENGETVFRESVEALKTSSTQKKLSTGFSHNSLSEILKRKANQTTKTDM